MNQKLFSSFTLATVLLVVSVSPVFAIQYSPGVTVSQYARYGNFVGSGVGYESFNDYGFLNYQVTSVSSNMVTFLSTGAYKNGTALPGNGTTDVWDLASGAKNGEPTTQGYVIAANLNQGNAIPPPNTYFVNQTVDRTYLGITRSVNILNLTVLTSDYNTTLNYVYDKQSGMVLESSSTSVTQSQPQVITSMFSYSIVATNIFGSTPSPTVPEFKPHILVFAAAIITVGIAVFTGWRKDQKKKNG
jgi:hypothetical protein